MRIAFDHQIFGWQVYGGISRYAYELAAELATSCQQDVAILSPLYVNRYLAHAPQQLKIQGVRAPAFKRSGRVYRAINSLLVRSPIERFEPDIVHETYYATRGVAPRNAKVVLTVYDMIHERFPEYFSIASPTRREKALAVTRADHVICISEQTRLDLIEFLGVSPAKTSVVHLGFSLTAAPQAAIKNGALPRQFVLYVGSRTGHKNFVGLLYAYAASKFLKDEFDLVCFGGGELTAKEKALINELGISAGKVRQVSGNDGLLGFYYEAARAFVYPSLYEGFGIPPLEAMSFGCPVVCSNTSSIPEVVGDAAEQFDPANHESMQKAIENVVGNDELRTNLIDKGSNRVGCFSWERCARETLDVYRRMCS
jgi:glycosyltransferase involved in cell wall biosynthesis